MSIRSIHLQFYMGVVSPLALFALIAVVVQQEFLDFDLQVLYLLHQYSSPLLDKFMIAVTMLGQNWGVIPFDISVSLVLLALRRWRMWSFFTISVTGAAALNVVLKLVFGRVRPSLWVIVSPELNASFPSGHTMGITAASVVVIFLLWSTKWRQLALMIGTTLIILVATSRVYLGVHYPTDVIAGVLASVAWVNGVLLVWERFWPRSEARL